MIRNLLMNTHRLSTGTWLQALRMSLPLLLAAAVCSRSFADDVGSTNTVTKPSTAAAGSNPIFRDTFTADPSTLVVGDTLYCYTGHDRAVGRQFFTMPDWLCYSTKDMKNWTRARFDHEGDGFQIWRQEFRVGGAGD